MQEQQGEVGKNSVDKNPHRWSVIKQTEDILCSGTASEYTYNQTHLSHS
jgi:hypothetical protein